LSLTDYSHPTDHLTAATLNIDTMPLFGVGSTMIDWDDQKLIEELSLLKKEAGVDNGTVSLDFTNSTDLQFCGVCRQVANSKCQSCLGVAYCSREHQKEHWKVHRPYCVLHEMVQDANGGAYLVAKHNIKKGEAIFTEKPYLVKGVLNFLI